MRTRRPPSLRILTATLSLGTALCLVTSAGATFESGHVRPLALSPDGSRLFAVNTPDHRLEIFDVTPGGLVHAGSVSVGLEPVAVAARTDDEVWVVNHLSDSVSILDVGSTPTRVTRTLLVGDEPRDLVFAGPTDGAGHFERAFITTARRGQNSPIDPLLTAEGTPRALVWVFDTTNLGTSLEGTAETILELFGDTPRALAATADGSTVYAAVFHSGNQTTALSEGAVCNGGSGAGACALDGIQIPGGLGGALVPGGLPAPNLNTQGINGPEVGLIVKLNRSNGLWEDELGRNWTNAVRFDLPDLDVFSIDADAGTPVETASFAHVGTILFNMLVNPANGKLYVTNTEARNEVRFEGPGILGTTVRGRLHEARITVLDGTNVDARHLNKHITALPLGYATNPMPAAVEDSSLATPMGMALSSAGTLYVAAFGSSKIGILDSAAIENDTFVPSPASHIELSGGGPSGLVLDEANGKLYVLTRFDNAVKEIDTASATETAAHSLHSPEAEVVKDGRRILYDARFTSSNGESSCSSCHVFGDFDSLAWDLGNPDDVVAPNPNPFFSIGTGVPFHPMKGPMTTQTLRGMDDHGPMHWRGDRTGGNATPAGDPLDEKLAFEAFNLAFEGLIGRDEGEIPEADMSDFADFILHVKLPPNPIKSLDNQDSPAEATARALWFGRTTDVVNNCNGCHELNATQGFFGGNGGSSFENETQEFKVPHLRNIYQKIGMFGMPGIPFLSVPVAGRQHQGPQVRGFGMLHDGAIDTVFHFFRATVFSLSETEQLQLEQFAHAFDTTYAPIVGQQATLTSTNGATVGPRIDLMIARALAPFDLVNQPGATECDLVVKGNVAGEARGFLMNPVGMFEADRLFDPSLSDGALRALAVGGQELTYTCVPPGAGLQIGIDRDGDGSFDRDETDAGTDPADPSSFPGATNDSMLIGDRIQIQNRAPDDEQKNKIVLVSKDPTITTPPPGGPNDPRCGADPIGTVKSRLQVSSATSGQSHLTDLPCQNWALLGSTANPRGYRYKDPQLDDGTVKSVVWRNGKVWKAALRGKGPSVLDYDLKVAVSEGEVTASFRSGLERLCIACTAPLGQDGILGKLFRGRTCPAPPSCS
ncbi:MAG: hypothetical protein P8R42_19125 [Candidatus Binatia bacterium]|nr:hypothetical protein [Candidatus Binatia bacterium]